MMIAPVGLGEKPAVAQPKISAAYAQNIENIVQPKPTPSASEKYEMMLDKLHAAQAEEKRQADELAAKEAAEAAAREAAKKAAEAEQARQAAARAQASYPNTYTWGQCTWYVASRRSVPPYWGNANTWAANAATAGWTVTSVPQAGAIAQTTAGYYGHVAYVEAVYDGTILISEMNFDGGVGVVHQRVVPASDFVYIY